MKLKRSLAFISLAFLVYLATSCEGFRTKTFKHYLFPFQTVVTKVDNDVCTNSVTEKFLSRLSDWEERWLKKKNTINFAEESNFGEQLHADLQAKLVAGAPLERVRRVFNKLKPYSRNKRYAYEIYVINEPFVNACSAPGGKIYCTLPLVEELDDDELAFVIGHELGHLENLHCLKSASRFSKLGGLYSLVTTGLHQKDELEADYAGAYLAYKGGFDPQSGQKLFTRWAEKEENSKWTTLLQSHPNAAQRADCVGDYVNQAEQEGEMKIYPLYYLFAKEYPFTVLGGLVFLGLLGYTAYQGAWQNCAKYGFLMLIAGGLYFGLDKNSPRFNATVGFVGLDDETSSLTLRASPEKTDENGIASMPHAAPIHIAVAGPWSKIDGKEGRWMLVTYDDEVNGWAWGWKLKTGEKNN